MRSENEPILGEILQKLERDEKNGKTIGLAYVPSHVGIPGNEKADRVATRAGHQSIAEIRAPFRDYFNSCWTAFRAKWQEEWQAQVHNKLQIVNPIQQE